MRYHSLTKLIEEYRRHVAEVAKLQAEIDAELPAALSALPAAYGYADMDSFIKAVVQACRKSPGRKKGRASQSHTQPAQTATYSGMAKAAKPASPSAEPPRPTGTTLDDPKNFGLMPDQSLLETPEGAQQAKLADALKFAQQVLHTSGVPAAVWREWRQFERKAADLLRTLNTVTHTE